MVRARGLYPTKTAIDAHGVATLLASSTGLGPDGGITIIPNNPALYGPLAGKILGVDDGNGTLIDAAGNVTQVSTPGLANAQWTSIVPGAANFFTYYDQQHGIFGPTAASLLRSRGRLWWPYGAKTRTRA